MLCHVRRALTKTAPIKIVDFNKKMKTTVCFILKKIEFVLELLPPLRIRFYSTAVARGARRYPEKQANN